MSNLVQSRKSKSAYCWSALSTLGIGVSGGLVASMLSPEYSHAFASAEFAIRELCSHMSGNLGALLMTTAGVGAVASAAFGNMKASYSFLITGIGAFTISALLSLYFENAAQICDGGGGGAGARTIGTITAPAAAGNTNSALNKALNAIPGIGFPSQALPQGNPEGAIVPGTQATGSSETEDRAAFDPDIPEDVQDLADSF